MVSGRFELTNVNSCGSKETLMAWQKGPLPADTYGWGGVVTTAIAGGTGFLFADFRGDHVVAVGDETGARIEPADVVCFDNSLTLPPIC